MTEQRKAVYATATKVSVEQSRNEIERILVRYGAERFLYGWDGDQAAIAFRINGRHIRFTLPLPSRTDKRFTEYRRGHSSVAERAPAEAEKLWEQACRQRWRALVLIIKAKLEAIDAGIVTLEDEFLANTLLPDGQTFGEWAKPQVEEIYLNGRMPQLLIEGAKP